MLDWCCIIVPKLITFSTIAYLLFAINSSAIGQSSDEKILKIGVLLPLSGKFQNIGESFLKSIQLALYEIENKNIKIFPKDSKANGFDSYNAAKEFEKNGIKIVLGPIFFWKFRKIKWSGQGYIYLFYKSDPQNC